MFQRPGRRRRRPSGDHRDRPEQLRRRQPGPHPDDGPGRPQHRPGPKQALADAGYYSQTNLEAAAKLTPSRTTPEFLIAPGRFGHDEVAPPAPRGQIPKDHTLKQPMARKLRTKTGKADYARRKAIVEPVFGQIATLQGKHVLLRGQDHARSQWQLLATCHNLRKLLSHLAVTGLGSLQTAT